MNTNLYRRIAVNGIKNNREVTFPYILTFGFLVMVHYIISYMAVMDFPETMRGVRTLRTVLPLGAYIIAIFSAIFLFYISTFLLRRRTKEFGLYSVLGMTKGNLGRIVIAEQLMTGGCSIVIGLLSGILFSKLAELGLYRLMSQEVSLALHLPLEAVVQTAAIYALLEVLLIGRSLILVFRNNPLALMSAGRKGEKKLRVNWVFAVLGLAALIAAYYLALSIESPLTAFFTFFAAVLLVIAATYLLFISGSVAFCSGLKKNKRFYYNKKHFIPVSFMTWRMSRNGAGLASICVLSTMVLVTLSTITSLSAGTVQSINKAYPFDVNLGLEITGREKDEKLTGQLQEIAEKYEKQATELHEYVVAESYGMLENGHLEMDSSMYYSNVYEVLGDVFSLENLVNLYVMSVDDFNQTMGQSISLGEGECAVCMDSGEYPFEQLRFSCGEIEGLTYSVVRKLDSSVFKGGYLGFDGQVFSSLTVVVPDLMEFEAPLDAAEDSFNERMVATCWECDFDLAGTDEEKIQTGERFLDEIEAVFEGNGYTYQYGCKVKELQEALGTNASLLYIGLFLAAVFLVATVLIIYYKQISEGYEDEKNFEIMQKVGMRKDEIRKSINAQMRMVFLLPVLFAGIHMVFAFRFTSQILRMLGALDEGLTVAVTFACFGVLAVLYAVIYRFTTRAYYKIVSKEL